MAAPNLKSPTTVTGKTATAGLTTSLTSVLSNGAASNTVLKVNTIRTANTSASAVTVDIAHFRPASASAVTRTQDASSSSDITSGEVGTYIISSGYTYWHKNASNGSANYTGTVLEYLVNATFPLNVVISVDGTPTTVQLQSVQNNAGYVRLDHSGFTSTSGTTGSSWILSLPSTTRYVLKGGAVDTGKSLIVTDKNEYIYLEEGDELRASASTGASVDMTINYEEIS
jgi:hypothetical protein